MPQVSKIYPREKLAEIIASLKKDGKTVGVTNGAFDILHAGHVKYLEDAKKLCDVLIVSINTDDSVKQYKDPNRPINPEEDRARVVAGLESVDYVTFHPERRMRETLLALKPNFYIKGGDYNPESLTSKDVLDGWGGKVEFIPFLPGRSTSKIIHTIVHRYADATIGTELKIPETKQKAVIFDRDGVINEEVEYLHDSEKVKIIPYAIEGLKKLQGLGYHLVIVTNQPGIGLGYFTEEDFYKVNKKILSELHKNNIVISKIYFCPHSLAENCDCRKPKTRLLERAQIDLNLDPKMTWLIGDRKTDTQAGMKMGYRNILVTTGHGGEYDECTQEPDFIAKNLVEVAHIIENNP